MLSDMTDILALTRYNYPLGFDCLMEVLEMFWKTSLRTSPKLKEVPGIVLSLCLEYNHLQEEKAHSTNKEK